MLGAALKPFSAIKQCNMRINVALSAILVIECLLMTSTVLGNSDIYFNVAKGKAVSLDDPDAVCGASSGEETYCRSRSNEESVSVCAPLTCRSACPYTSSIETTTLQFDVLNSHTTEGDFGSCVVKENISTPEVGDNTVAMHFLSLPLDETCALTLSNIFYIAYLISGEWNVTYQFYIKHTMLDNEEG